MASFVDRTKGIHTFFYRKRHDNGQIDRYFDRQREIHTDKDEANIQTNRQKDTVNLS